MKHWVRGIALALVFGVVGAFSASLWLEVRHDAAASIEPAAGLWEGRRIRVEVLNGAGIDGLARLATEQLRSRGFDVVYYGNAEEFDRDSSVAIARLDRVEPARRVADALGVYKVTHHPDRNLYLDVSVILGADWTAPVGEATEESGSGSGIWWARLKRAARRLWPG